MDHSLTVGLYFIVRRARLKGFLDHIGFLGCSLPTPATVSGGFAFGKPTLPPSGVNATLQLIFFIEAVNETNRQNKNKILLMKSLNSLSLSPYLTRPLSSASKAAAPPEPGDGALLAVHLRPEAAAQIGHGGGKRGKRRRQRRKRSGRRSWWSESREPGEALQGVGSHQPFRGEQVGLSPAADRDAQLALLYFFFFLSPVTQQSWWNCRNVTWPAHSLSSPLLSSLKMSSRSSLLHHSVGVVLCWWTAAQPRLSPAHNLSRQHRGGCDEDERRFVQWWGVGGKGQLRVQC